MSAQPVMQSEFIIQSLRKRVAELEAQLTPRLLRPDPLGEKILSHLTLKEKDIIRGVMDGLDNRKIGARLKTTEQVIKNYLGKIYEKFGVNDRLNLALFVFHHSALRRALR